MEPFNFNENKDIDVLCMGRVGVDLYASEVNQPLADVGTFKKYLGGSPANISVGSARLGLKSQLLSKVGDDEMGHFLKKELIKERVDVSLLSKTPAHLTALVLLGVSPPDDFPLMFYRENCADMQLKATDFSAQDIARAKVFLFSGTGISTHEMREATLVALEAAHHNEVQVVLDLDYRPVLWGLTDKGDGERRFSSNPKVSRTYQEFLPWCSVIVGTSEELCIAGGSEDLHQAILTIQSLSRAFIVHKEGLEGSRVYAPNSQRQAHAKAFPLEVLNTLGAGDAYLSGLLYGLLNKKSWHESLTLANINGALVSTRHSCSNAMGVPKELEFIKEHYQTFGRDIILNSQFKGLGKESNKISPSPLIRHKDTFPYGLNSIVEEKDKFNSKMNFSVLKLKADEVYDLTSSFESAALLMSGTVCFQWAEEKREVTRESYFEQAPTVLHLAKEEKGLIAAKSSCELLIMQVPNETYFKPMLFDESNMLENDLRGKGLLNDSSYRVVRTVFDKRNRKESNMVVGEIITFSGHWSSYPPHTHPHPEIYHYRFSEPEGFAFSEDGDEALKVHHNDTLVILDEKAHAHAVAPGYALYTLWFIRHLNNNPYIVPDFKKEHEWTKELSANERAYPVE